MKLNEVMKRVVAVAVSAATVAATVSIADAYTIDRETDYGSAVNIFGESGSHFVFAENDAIKQARSFKLNVYILTAGSDEIIPACATLEYGSYSSNGNEVKLGELVKEEEFFGDLTGTLPAEQVESGRFWLRAPEDSYSLVEFHSISFFDESGSCILYGSADKEEHKWTFYRLESPTISVSGDSNPDGSYVNGVEVSVTGATYPMTTLYYNDSNRNACTWGDDISTVLKKDGVTIDSNDNITFTEGGHNEYEYSAYTTVTLTDAMNYDDEGNPILVELYSPVVKTTVKLSGQVGLVNPDAPVVVDESALTAGALEGRTASDILSSVNALTGTNTVTDGVKLGIDGLPDCRIAKITDKDLSGNVVRNFYVPVTYTGVQGFDPDIRAEQTATLLGEADLSMLDVPEDYGNTVTVTGVKIASDYLTGVTLTAPTKTAYTYGESLDLTGGKLTLSYEQSADAELLLTDSKVKVTGDISSLGTGTITVEYLAAQDEAKEGAVISKTFEVTVDSAGTVSTPAISPNGGTFIGSQKVTVTCATEGAKIYYTTDGSAPATNSKLYEGAFTITATTTVKAIAVKEGMADSEVVTAKFTKKSSVGSSGGSSGGGSSGTTTPTTTNPSIGGSSKSWSDVAADLGKLTSDAEATIELNGSTTVPVDVIKSIADSGSNVKLVINSSYAWVVDGADITAPASADLTFTKTTNTKSGVLRGTEGTQFKINNTGIPTSLEIAFKTSNAGKFANLYKNVNGKLTFVTCAKLGTDGKVILPEVTEKGNYVAMLCEFSDRPGDMDNDGVMSAKDSSAILNDIVGLEQGDNPLMADINGDGHINALDASAILKRIVGLA